MVNNTEAHTRYRRHCGFSTLLDANAQVAAAQRNGERDLHGE
jgi:hypothetical protein